MMNKRLKNKRELQWTYESKARVFATYLKIAWRSKRDDDVDDGWFSFNGEWILLRVRGYIYRVG